MVAFDSPILRPFAQPGDRAACLARGGDAYEPGSPSRHPEAILRMLVAEHAPVGLREEHFVKQLADQMAALDELTAARQTAIRLGTAVFSEFARLGGRQGSQQAPPPMGSSDEDTTATWPVADEVRVAAMTSPEVTRIERRIERTQKRVLEISRHLEKLQEHRRVRDLPRLAACAGLTINRASDPVELPSASPPAAAAEARRMVEHGESHGRWATAETDADCERIFRNWIRGAGLPCPNCGSREQARELSNRRVLQCRGCGSQRGLRHGTFLAHSNVGFLAAFRTVRLLAVDPRAPISMLRRVTGLSVRSARGWRSRILEALEDPAQRSSVLAACGWQPEQVPST